MKITLEKPIKEKSIENNKSNEEKKNREIKKIVAEITLNGDKYFEKTKEKYNPVSVLLGDSVKIEDDTINFSSDPSQEDKLFACYHFEKNFMPLLLGYIGAGKKIGAEKKETVDFEKISLIKEKKEEEGREIQEKKEEIKELEEESPEESKKLDNLLKHSDISKPKRKNFIKLVLAFYNYANGKLSKEAFDSQLFDCFPPCSFDALDAFLFDKVELADLRFQSGELNEKTILRIQAGNDEDAGRKIERFVNLFLHYSKNAIGKDSPSIETIYLGGHWYNKRSLLSVLPKIGRYFGQLKKINFSCDDSVFELHDLPKIKNIGKDNITFSFLVPSLSNSGKTEYVTLSRSDFGGLEQKFQMSTVNALFKKKWTVLKNENKIRIICGGNIYYDGDKKKFPVSSESIATAINSETMKEELIKKFQQYPQIKELTIEGDNADFSDIHFAGAVLKQYPHFNAIQRINLEKCNFTSSLQKNYLIDAIKNSSVRSVTLPLSLSGEDTVEWAKDILHECPTVTEIKCSEKETSEEARQTIKNCCQAKNLYNEGVALLKNADTKQKKEKDSFMALDLFRQLFELDLDNNKGVFLLKNADTKQKKEKDSFMAVDLFRQSLELDPDNANVYLSEAYILCGLEAYPQAIARVKKAVQLPPEKITLFFGQGQFFAALVKEKPAYQDVYNGVDLTQEIILSFKKVWTLDPDKQSDDSWGKKGITELLALGTACFETKLYKSAMQYFNAVIELDPNNKEAWLHKARCFYRMEVYSKEAKQCFDKAMILSTRGVVGYNNYQEAYYRTLLEKAAFFIDLARNDPSDANIKQESDVLFALALRPPAMYVGTKFDTAMQMMSSLTKLGKKLFDLKRYEEALRFFDAARTYKEAILSAFENSDMSPPSRHELYEIGYTIRLNTALAYQGLKDYEKAMKAFSAFCWFEFPNPAPFVKQGQFFVDFAKAYPKMDLKKKAIESFEEAHRLALKDENHAVLLELGNIYLKDKQYEKALNCFDEATKLNKGSPSAWLNKAYCLRIIGRKARQLADGVQKASEHFKNAMLSYETAINCFDKAIGNEKDQVARATIYLEKALALHSFGEHGEAIECFKAAIKLNPNDPILFFKQALLFVDLATLPGVDNDRNFTQDAIQSFQTAHKLDPTNLDILLELGITCFNRGDFKNYALALDSFNRAIVLEPDKNSSRYAQLTKYKERASGKIIRFFESMQNINLPFVSDIPKEVSEETKKEIEKLKKLSNSQEEKLQEGGKELSFFQKNKKEEEDEEQITLKNSEEKEEEILPHVNNLKLA